ncbi:L-aspartate oxidase [Alicyclobacillus shizuokensis]|uniref:L-aspartate oxidase n=1 Tax=Alicyclobacillus shizuokensis TaxID=392014 RepID=UPI000837A770|nr:L-aspartate oxidase [Alicyclobacillus shizuokensis]
MTREVCDFVVVGSGLAGTTASWLLAEFSEVLQVSQTPPEGSNSWAAQGGVAAATRDSDSPRLHALDTLAAGKGLCDARHVQRLAERAPQLMAWLASIGAAFDRDEAGQVRLGLEGAHSQPRIWHAGGDATGRHLLQAVREAASRQPNLACWTDMQVRGLLLSGGRVVGVSGLRRGRTVIVYARRAVILASGGIGQLYPYTSNPQGAVGSGIALAYRAGAQAANMEFVQFHPTVLDVPGNPRFLISEAVRGAGARLIDERGEPLMATFPRQDLEPRDVVARQIHQRLLTGGRVFLDARRVADFADHFPTIAQRLAECGIHPARDPFPVAPAAHFFMGGIRADLSGRTSLPGLFVLGEAACTGVHGANRLASNSLLECLLMAHECAAHWRSRETRGADGRIEGMTARRNTPAADQAPRWTGAAGAGPGEAEEQVEIRPDDEPLLNEVRQILWTAGGIVRDEANLTSGLRRVADLAAQRPDSPAVTLATLILRAARLRDESRGAHFRSDAPETSSAWDDAVIVWERHGTDDVPRTASATAAPGCTESAAASLVNTSAAQP